MCRSLLPLLAFSFVLVACGGESPPNGGGPDTVHRGPTRVPLDGDPNGLFWDAATETLYIADDNNNRILAWTDKAGVALAAELPPAPPDGPGLGQLVKTADGTFYVTRFGFGTAGAVVFVGPDGKSGVVPNLDPVRRRLGLAIGPDGKLYDSFFTDVNGVKLGSVAELDPAGKEVEILKSLQKPVGLLVVGADLVVADQGQGVVARAPLSMPDSLTVLAQVPKPDLLCEGPNGTFFTGGKEGTVRQIQGGGKYNDFASGFQEARGVAYDAKNRRLFIADHDGIEADGITHALQIVPVD